MATRVAIRIFGTMVSDSSLSVAVAILQFVYDLTVSQAWHRHHSTRILIRVTVIPLDWRRVGDSCRNPFFWDNGKCIVFFVAVTFYISYMISPFLEHVLGINRRGI